MTGQKIERNETKLKIYLIDFENVKSKGLEGIDKLSETDSVIIFFSENSDTLSFEMHQKVLSSKADIEYFKVSVGGKNALDFQLSTLLGYMVAKEIYTHIFVISNDKGFDFLHTFWGGKYIDSPKTFVYRTKTILAAMQYEQSVSEEESELQKLEENIRQIELDFDFPELPGSEAEAVVRSEPVSEKAAAAQSEKPEKPAKTKKKIDRKKDQTFDEMFGDLLDGKCKKGSYDKIKTLFVKSETKEEFHNTLAKTYKQQGSDIYKAVKSKYLRLKEKYNEENPEPSAPVPEPAKLPDKLSELLSGLCEPADIDRVRKCFDTTVNKRDFYISMVKEFQMKKGCEYYNAVKPHYNELAKKVQES